jgi:hypothetical protein
MQGRIPQVVPGVHVGPVFDEASGDVQEAVGGGDMQRRHAVRIPGRHLIGGFFQQRFQGGRISLLNDLKNVLPEARFEA